MVSFLFKCLLWSGWLVAALVLFAPRSGAPVLEAAPRTEAFPFAPLDEPEAQPQERPAPSAAGCNGTLPSYRGLRKLADLAADERWEMRVRKLEEELTSARRQGERYRLDLVRALQLLRATPPSRGSSSSPGRSSAQVRRASRPRVSANTPRVRLLGSDAFISGQVRNSGSADARVELELELVLENRVYDRTILHLSVPAGSTQPYTHTFPTSLADGTYAARAKVRTW